MEKNYTLKNFMICTAHINIIRVVKARRMREVRHVAGGICRKDAIPEDLSVVGKLISHGY